MLYLSQIMDTNQAAKYLSEIDEPDQWSKKSAHIEIINKREAYNLAEPLWLERMYREGKLFVHPNIAKQLKNQSWIANDLQKRMIWASVIASAEGPDSKARFVDIKKKLLKKYGREWWEDVYQRKNNAWAAKSRIEKKKASNGPAVTTLINNTHLFAGVAASETIKALKMIPET